MANTEDLNNKFNELDNQTQDASPETVLDPTKGARPSGDDVPPTPGLVDESLATKTQEAQDFEDKYLRLAAEFENYKRLALRDLRDHVQFANERILKALLPVIDNLERAIRSGKDNPNGAALLEGIELTLKQALEVLGKFGVRQINTTAEQFDPTCHQAMTRVDTDKLPENAVVEEFERGYYLHDRVLRAAMVSVAARNSSSDSGGRSKAERGTAEKDESSGNFPSKRHP